MWGRPSETGVGTADVAGLVPYGGEPCAQVDVVDVFEQLAGFDLFGEVRAFDLAVEFRASLADVDVAHAEALDVRVESDPKAMTVHLQSVVNPCGDLIGRLCLGAGLVAARSAYQP